MKQKIMILLLCLFTSLSLNAAEKVALYSAEVKIADESRSERKIAIRKALKKVLIKLTGVRHIEQQPGSRRLLAAASSLAQQFKYRREDVLENKNTNGIEAEIVEKPSKIQRYINVTFGRNAVDSRLREAGLPVWGNPRPSLLLWLVVDNGNQKGLINADQLADKNKLLSGLAHLRGIPIRLPLMDLEDLSSLSVSDVINSRFNVIKSASGRYDHDVILTGYLRLLSANKWRVDWRLYNKNDVSVLTSNTLSFDEALLDGINQSADVLANYYAPILSSKGITQIKMQINDVTSIKKYGEIIALLKRQEVVKRLVVNKLEENQVSLDLWLRGGVEIFKHALSLSDRLVFLNQLSFEPIITPVIESILVEEDKNNELERPAAEPSDNVIVEPTASDQMILQYRLK